ncbi:hypothetical protein SMGD1_2839 [Sulfurimonas gotlandica GD1]|uniref:Secreted protein n=1 Tax=Sulfurimonas gotlandica (strain DSM 19862 / JCM 16533 / GD1) TaxID=929558 RepID=H1FU55_SULGG|nr:hypothetical protein [Sulfurimonas gotlandica]EHP31361.1 hypothetical protein SMGD1_2839 [Sulfurimonas gotlandica GD1]
MKKIILSIILLSSFLAASDYSRANDAAAKAMDKLDCDFEDCPKPAPKPEVIIQEKVIVVEKPVLVEKVIVKEKVIIIDRPAASKTKLFMGPSVDGYALDICYTWGGSCGKPAADAYCRLMEYSSSVSHVVKNDTPPTKIISSGRVCDGWYCDRISEVTCTK